MRAAVIEDGICDDAADLLESDTRQTAPLPAFFRVRDVLRITALSRPTLYRRIAAGKFPPPVHLGGRACAWSRAALQKWISDPERYCTQEPLDPTVRRARGRPRKYGATQSG